MEATGATSAVVTGSGRAEVPGSVQVEAEAMAVLAEVGGCCGIQILI